MDNKAVLIEVDGTRTTINWNNDNLSALVHMAVGGFFELVNLPSKDMIMWVNENGIAGGLDPNPLATTFYIEEYGPVPPIFGNAVFTGSANSDSNCDGLTPLQVSLVYDHENIVTISFFELPESDLGNENINNNLSLDELEDMEKFEHEMEKSEDDN